MSEGPPEGTRYECLCAVCGDDITLKGDGHGWQHKAPTWMQDNHKARPTGKINVIADE